MRRFYLDNDSYPELRDVRRGLTRTLTWWRAMVDAVRHGRLVAFAALQLALLAAFVVAVIVLPAPISYAALLLLVLGGYLQVSLGGDMMRRHLRAVSDIARHACPSCGQSLRGHLGAGAERVRCPECATEVDTAIFDRPHAIPREHRAFPPWRRHGRVSPR